MHKPIICIDFDGVIHSYENGWQDGTIYGHVVPGFFEWATEAKKHFTLVIYSSRSKTSEGRSMMWAWLKHQWGSWKHHGAGKDLKDFVVYDDFDFANEKPPAYLTIDDRAITFSGKWSDYPVNVLKEFVPWNKKD